MHVEECCQALLGELLPRVDRWRRGVVIEVGLGTFAFYCLILRRLGYRVIAVEPLPVKKLRLACEKAQIELDEVCVSEIEGQVEMYVGEFEGKPDPNLNSLDPEWWGASSTKKTVRSTTLLGLVERKKISRLTCLKLDVEGAEHTILKQLRDIDDACLPRCVMFEYGGGATYETGAAGWGQNNLSRTMRCLKLLKHLGYDQAIRIDSAARSRERIEHLSRSEIRPESFFDEGCTYGNIVAFRDARFEPSEIERICAPYRWNDDPPPPIQMDPPLWLRARRFLRRCLS